MNIGMIEMLNIDCMEYMAGVPDNHFDLAIVDPPYLSKLGNPNGYYGNKSRSDTGIKRTKYKNFEKWDVPDFRYFNELFRISKNQIIWGCNYYAHLIPHVGRIIWDKKNDTSSFSKAEIASKSFNVGCDMFRFTWNGMIQQDMKNKEVRISPVQKPVALYRWLLDNYAKPNDLILDTHAGSFSSAVACKEKGFSGVFCEIDKDYFEAGKSRVDKTKRQYEIETEKRECSQYVL